MGRGCGRVGSEKEDWEGRRVSLGMGANRLKERGVGRSGVRSRGGRSGMSWCGRIETGRSGE